MLKKCIRKTFPRSGVFIFRRKQSQIEENNAHSPAGTPEECFSKPAALMPRLRLLTKQKRG
jgi:hypothetical protein